MKRFRSLEEIRAANLALPHRDLLIQLMTDLVQEIARLGGEYDPESDGEFVLLDEPGDCTRPLSEFEWADSVRDCLFEFVDYHDEARCFVAVYIPTNNWGLTFVIPDGDCIDAESCAWLSDQTSPVEEPEGGHHGAV